jgi:hypothetical protein
VPEMTTEAPRARKPRKITNPDIDQTAPAFRIMDKVGGLTPFSRLIERSVNTCYRWLVNGLIPANEQAHVQQCFADAGIELEPAEFVPAARAA